MRWLGLLRVHRFLRFCSALAAAIACSTRVLPPLGVPQRSVTQTRRAQIYWRQTRRYTATARCSAANASSSNTTRVGSCAPSHCSRSRATSTAGRNSDSASSEPPAPTNGAPPKSMGGAQHSSELLATASWASCRARCRRDSKSAAAICPCSAQSQPHCAHTTESKRERHTHRSMQEHLLQPRHALAGPPDMRR